MNCLNSLLDQVEKVKERLNIFTPITEKEAMIIAQSQFLLDQLHCHPEWLEDIRTNKPNESEGIQYHSQLSKLLVTVSSEIELMKQLRLFRHQQMVRICWAQLCRLCSTEQTLIQLSRLAEVSIFLTKEWLYDKCCQEYGIPCNDKGIQQPLLVIGMGKLGGEELNFSSDVDLIFTFPENGSTKGSKRILDNVQFFTRLGQRLIKVLEQPTVDGFAWRVDMRLRPFGDGSPLVFSFAAMEDYYQQQGRDWERYAMVKARVMGQEQENSTYSQELYSMLRPFVYRRYIDFSVIQSLRNMKSMIEREVRRRNVQNNIKLGAGGIREIEFVTQVFQLIRGGRVKTLQTRSLLTALQIIAEQSLLPKSVTLFLKDNYLFLRRLENLLQAIDDKQTQVLPDNELDQQRLAMGMDFNNWSLLAETITKVMQSTRQVFDTFFGGEEQAQGEQYHSNYQILWFDQCEPQDLHTLAPNYNTDECQQLIAIIEQFKQDINKRTIGNRGRDVLDKLIPILFSLLFKQSQPSALQVLPRIIQIILNIVSRTTYLELLIEYPIVLAQLVKLCHRSSMIATQLAQHPLLLDELIDSHTLYQPLALNEYLVELQRYLLRIPDEDEEQRIEALRQFKQMQLLHIAAADISDLLPVMKVSDHLTYLAEAFIHYVVQMAWEQMVKRYGRPAYLTDAEEKGLLIIAYGKLGGLELGYGSDLDLVFVTTCPEQDYTDGERSIPSPQFYVRLVQRIIHLFTTRTSSGQLYEIDIRLRPSGNAGLLACSIHAFEKYQQQEAWTWEHQALVRARAVYGEKSLRMQFDTIRCNVLSQIRDENELQKEVRDMRQKMRDHLSHHDEQQFDLKIDQGGIGDIEFISQYLVLRYAHQQPALTQWSDNVRILESLAQLAIMETAEASQLKNAYTLMRNRIHQLSLQQQSSKVSINEFKPQRSFVIQRWKTWLEG